jgi:hypothetical protein
MLKETMAVALTSLWLAQPASGQIVLVKDGRPQAEIVIAEKPARTARLAAEELQTYVEKMTGAKLPILTTPTAGTPVQVYVGRSGHTDRLGITDDGLKYGAFRMVSGPNWLALVGHDSEFTPKEPFHAGGPLKEDSPAMVAWDKITGAKWGFPTGNLFKEYSPALKIWEKDERGSFNAVCEFLLMQGVRWYLPDPLGEIVPNKATIELPKVNKTVRPDFPYRYPYQSGRMFAHQGTTRDEALWQLRLGWNNGLEPVGYQDVAIAHGSRIVHERPDMAKLHPEYFALYSGKRDTYTFGGGRPCLSSPGLFEDNVRFARAVFDTYNAPMVSAMPQDGYMSICQCDLCKGKDTLARGITGQLSDYVWDYVNRVATEVYKTHPDRKISCFAYGAYLLPPEKIAALSPNVVVGICQARSGFHDRKDRETFVALREAWRKKTSNSPLLIGDYYLNARPNMPWDGIPVTYPHLVAQDLRSLKGIALGNFIEVYRDPQGIKSLALDHINLYVTSRCWWDADLDVDALMEEYYTLYYGPAREEMKGFIGYCEGNWVDMRKSEEKIAKVFTLLDKARQKVPADSVYAKRIELIAEYIKPMKALAEQLAKGRKDTPVARGYWRDKADLILDGRLDDPFWQNMAWYPLRELQTGREPGSATAFKVAWSGDDLYVAIRCEDRDSPKLNIGTTRNGDPSIWNGDCVEILLETQTHPYYQVAVNPAGAMVTLDRRNGALNDKWSPNAQVATRVENGFWTVEIRIPVPGEQQEQLDPLHGVSGRRPNETYPWYFNICRQRVRDAGTEASAFSPTGIPSFHNTDVFAKLYVR